LLLSAIQWPEEGEEISECEYDNSTKNYKSRKDDANKSLKKNELSLRKIKKRKVIKMNVEFKNSKSCSRTSLQLPIAL
jgi:hypothetical protein